MRKPLVSLILLICTALLSLGMFLSAQANAPVEARIVSVSRADVHQVIAVTGRLAYAEEHYACAESVGRVSRVCVQPGQRVAAGEALVRLSGEVQQEALSAYAASDGANGNSSDTGVDEPPTMDSTVIRCGKACSVREILVEEGSIVAAGMPVARLSSCWQEIIANVSRGDALSIRAGMWAWLSYGGEPLGKAEVVSVGAPEADAQTGQICAGVVLRPEQYIELPEGTSITAEIYLAGSDDVLALPLEAITDRGTVWWVDQGRCTEIPAQIVLCDEMHAWVHLPEGLTVAIGEFKEGQRVKAGG